MNEEEIIFNNNVFKDELVKALDIVKDFIIEKKILLVGGFAIDIALKEKGSFIYDKFTIPDYDCFSSNHYEDSKELMTILCELNLSNVSLIPAIHTTTMRIKMLGYTLFDCTFIPENILKKIPVLQIKNYYMAHPNYIKLNQYNSLSFLFDITGVDYNIFNRLEKDLYRNKLLNTHYPINHFNHKMVYKKTRIPLRLLTHNDNKVINVYKDCDLLYSTKNINDAKLDKFINSNDVYFETNFDICLGSYFSYALETNKFIIKDDYIEVDVPENLILSLITNVKNTTDITDRINKELNIVNNKYYHPVLDIIPPCIYFDDTLFLNDLFGKLLSIDIKKYSGYNFITCSKYYSMYIFLFQYYITDNLDYLYIYNDIVNNLNPQPSLSTFGFEQYTDSELLYIKKIKGMNNSNDSPPKNYPVYPECKSNKTFNYEESTIFKIDGSENIEKVTNFGYILD